MCVCVCDRLVLNSSFVSFHYCMTRVVLRSVDWRVWDDYCTRQRSNLICIRSCVVGLSCFLLCRRFLFFSLYFISGFFSTISLSPSHRSFTSLNGRDTKNITVLKQTHTHTHTYLCYIMCIFVQVCSAVWYVCMCVHVCIVSFRSKTRFSFEMGGLTHTHAHRIKYLNNNNNNKDRFLHLNSHTRVRIAVFICARTSSRGEHFTRFVKVVIR